ncbi:MAG: hypothetical protein ABIH41_02980 [Nanoarchaeota archaeon]
MVSNRALSLLIVAAVVISVGGQIWSVNQIQSARILTPGLPTGYAVAATGMVNLTILSQTDITLSGDVIDFGTGVVNSSSGCNNATLHSNGTGVNTDACWVNQSLTPNSAIPATQAKFILNNSGNVNISITLDSIKNNATNFLGNSTIIDAFYQYTVNQNGSGQPCQTTLATGWNNFSASSTMSVCGELFWEDGKDAVNVAILVRIPEDVERGYKNDNLTFTSAQA